MASSEPSMPPTPTAEPPRHQHAQGLAQSDAWLAAVLPLPRRPLGPTGQRVDGDQFLDLAAPQHEPVLAQRRQPPVQPVTAQQLHLHVRVDLG